MIRAQRAWLWAALDAGIDLMSDSLNLQHLTTIDYRCDI